MPIFKTSKKGKARTAAKRLKAIIYLNNVPDHKEPYDLLYCVKLAFKLDPKGEILRVQVTE